MEVNFSKWCEQLLDTGKRNKLINYKDSKLRTLEILAPDTEFIFNRIKSGGKFAFHDVDEYIRKNSRKTEIDELMDALDIEAPEKPALTPAQIYDALAPKLRQGELLGYKKFYSLKKVLGSLKKIAKESLTEKGINILYLAFGFLNWKESPDSDIRYSSPLNLIPVAIENDPVKDSFYIHQYEDEISTNPTLQYKLKAEFNIDLPAFEEDSAEGLKDYFAKINLLVEKRGWFVSENTALGTFSFYKMNMYNDLKENEAKIVRNNNIARLLNKKEYEEGAPAGEAVTENYFEIGMDTELHNVVDADSSQVEAIIEAKSGRSMVLQGPPGTGKSQTITNLIAEFLSENKKVLFVSEKLAALQVVYSNLAKVGLSDFCLELHSNKSNKRDVIEELYRTMNLAGTRVSDRVNDEINSLLQSKSQLDRYASVLHNRQEVIERTPYEILGSISRFQNAKEFEYIIPDIGNKGAGYLSQAESVLSDYQNTKAFIGPDFRKNCWYGYIKQDNSYQAQVDLKKILADVKDYLDRMGALIRNLNKKYNLDIGTLNDINKTVSAFKAVDRLAGEIGKVFNDDFYSLDLKALQKRFKTEYAGFLRIFKAGYKRDMRLLASCAKGEKRIKYRLVAELLDSGIEYLRLKEEMNAGGDIKKVISVFDTLYAHEPISALQKDFAAEYVLADIEIDKLALKIKKCTDNFDMLNPWLNFIKIAGRLNGLGLYDFVIAAADNGIPIDGIDKTFKKMFYTQWFIHLLNVNETLGGFSRISQDKAVEVFKEKDKFKFKISKAKIVAGLAARRPNLGVASIGGQVALLQREANKSKKHMPVRVLLKSIPELVLTLKPCFLMSPLSVSTYLADDKMKFDVVIFDEASQIFPWDAVGSIYRAKQVIVAGDSKQMPPSNFFNAGVIDEEDDGQYFDDSLDFESILDLCSAAFPKKHLKWHYRSRVEELIAFSNKNYYGGNLVTFPSVRNYGDWGVEFYYVKNGIFDRKLKSNIREAEKVADLIYEHFEKYGDKRSLGVVAFSVSQQETIENILQKRRNKNDKFAKFFDEKINEPFFIKNLETIQGDERDTIIFSVAYAKDASGKFIHNFGPLNQNGGERRLNVAITRAKYNVKLVASIRSFDIDLNKSQAEGTRMLKEYLDYAENGGEASGKDIVKSAGAQPDSGFEAEVYGALTAAGYKTDTKVGCSGFRIDLAVKHPVKDIYVLAAECDGATYRSGRSARDRDRLRQEVLERLGWNYYRVWSTDWFKNKTAEKQRLLEAVEKAIRAFDGNDVMISDNAGAKAAEEKAEIEIAVERAPEIRGLKDIFPKYTEADINALASKHSKRGKLDFEKFVTAVVAAEQPITEELLLKKIVRVLDRGKVTNAVRESFRLRMQSNLLVEKINDYYTADMTAPIGLRIPEEGKAGRDIGLICTEELADGMRRVIALNIGIAKEGLFKTITNLLGFSRMGTSITNSLEKALDFLLRRKIIKKESDTYLINE